MVSSGSDVRGRMDPSVRRSCIRTQDAGVLSRLEISVRRFALVDEQGSRSRMVGVGFSRRVRDSAFSEFVESRARLSAVIPKILFHQIGGYLPRLDFRRIVRISVSQML